MGDGANIAAAQYGIRIHTWSTNGDPHSEGGAGDIPGILLDSSTICILHCGIAEVDYGCFVQAKSFFKLFFHLKVSFLIKHLLRYY